MSASTTASFGRLTVASVRAASATVGGETDSTSVDTTTTPTTDNSTKIIIIYQKSTISQNVQKALSTIAGGVHIWSPTIDGQKLDAPAFAAATYSCLILHSGDPNSKTAAADVHTWVANNRAYIKSTGMVLYVVPTKIFSFAGLKSVYADLGTTIKAIPKWAENLEHLLLNLEDQFPASEHSVIRALINKIIGFITKKE